jgi:ADP-ribose pyrophosphatase
MSDRFVYDKLVHKGPVAEVHDVGVRTDDGGVLPRDLICMAQAAVILPVLDDGRIVLIRNERFAVGQELIELPAGKLDPGEGAESAASRELTEETGYLAGKLVKLGEFYSTPGATDELLHAYVATGLQAGPQQLQGAERITVEVRTMAEVKQMSGDGRIRDGKTLATLALYWISLERINGAR